MVLLLLAFVCVPWMLCTKPYLMYREHQKIKEQGYHGVSSGANTNGGGLLSGTDDEGDDVNGQGHAVVAEEMDEEHEFDMGEHVIHQIIREFQKKRCPCLQGNLR